MLFRGEIRCSRKYWVLPIPLLLYTYYIYITILFVCVYPVRIWAWETPIKNSIGGTFLFFPPLFSIGGPECQDKKQLSLFQSHWRPVATQRAAEFFILRQKAFCHRLCLHFYVHTCAKAPKHKLKNVIRNNRFQEVASSSFMIGTQCLIFHEVKIFFGSEKN